MIRVYGFAQNARSGLYISLAGGIFARISAVIGHSRCRGTDCTILDGAANRCSNKRTSADGVTVVAVAPTSYRSTLDFVRGSRGSPSLRPFFAVSEWRTSKWTVGQRYRKFRARWDVPSVNLFHITATRTCRRERKRTVQGLGR